MRDPELLAHLMAELTGRFEDLAAEAASMQDARSLTTAAIAKICANVEQASHLCMAARVLASE